MEKLVNELLLGIEPRGMDATGVAAVTPDGELHIEKADIEATRFNWWRSKLPEKPQTVLLHTRFATQGSPMNLANNHPIRYNNVVVTHNGHISNDDAIFEDEELARIAQVDSECIAALFDKYGIDKAHIPLGKLDGNMAVAVSDLRKPGTLVLAKGWQSPLYYYKATEGVIWASTSSTIIDGAKKALNLDLKQLDIDSLSYGQLLLIEDGEVEKLKFKPYEKPVVYYGRQHDWYRENQKENKSNITKTTADEFYKSDPLHVEFWENEKHPIAYSVKTGGNTFLFKSCDGCNTNYQTTLLTIIEDDSILCNKCLREHDAANEVGDNPAVVHEVVIELVAERFSTNPDFVNWLLFDSDDDEIAYDSSLVNLYITCNDAYDEIHKELTGNLYGAASRFSDIATERDDEGEEEFEDEELLEECGVQAFAETSRLGWLRNILA